MTNRNKNRKIGKKMRRTTMDHSIQNMKRDRKTVTMKEETGRDDTIRPQRTRTVCAFAPEIWMLMLVIKMQMERKSERYTSGKELRVHTLAIMMEVFAVARGSK